MQSQLDLFSQAPTPYSVSEITARIRALLEREPVLQDFWVMGEISNFSRASSGHLYFTLKDAGAALSAVVWRAQAQAMRYLPANGDKVLAHGKIGVYEPGGRYQMYVDALRPAGRGDLHAEFERLKAQLDAEGLFAPERKRPLPPHPRRIGVVTSPTTAAFRDVLNVLGRRYPLAEVLLSPTPVQGDAAPPQIVAALAALNAYCSSPARGGGGDGIDVILVVRGGGSLEDLWAFNDERVARAIAASRLPVVSGVGHEIDFTLADFAADLRAPTPSAAAELATPDVAELRATLAQRQARLERVFAADIAGRRERVTQMTRSLEHLAPLTRLASARQRVDDLAARADLALARQIEAQRQRVTALAARLEALNPEAVLSRGYAIVHERETGKVLTQAAQVTPGLALTIQWQDGEMAAEVVDGRQ